MCNTTPPKPTSRNGNSTHGSTLEELPVSLGEVTPGLILSAVVLVFQIKLTQYEHHRVRSRSTRLVSLELKPKRRLSNLRSKLDESSVVPRKDWPPSCSPQYRG